MLIALSYAPSQPHALVSAGDRVGLVRGMTGYLRMDGSGTYLTGLGTSWAAGPTLSLGSSPVVGLI